MSKINAQHRTPIPIPQRPFSEVLPGLPQMRRRPFNPPASIILIMQISLRLTIIRRIQCLSIHGTSIRRRAMSGVRPEDQHLTGLKLNRCPFLLRDPGGWDAVVFADWDLYFVGALDDFEAAVGHVGGVYGEEDGEVLDVLDVGVGCGVDVGLPGQHVQFLLEVSSGLQQSHRCLPACS
jgi:hypothetical protein